MSALARELETLCATIAERVHELLERRALEHDGSVEHSLALALSRSPARRGADEHAPEGTDPDHDGEPGWKRKARVSGFDLEATIEVRGEDRERLENLAISFAPLWPTGACASCLPTRWPSSSRAPGRTARLGSR